MNSTLIARIKDHCRTRGFYIQDELNPYNRKQNGVASLIGFRRFFSNIQFQITEQQFNMLCTEYAVPNGIDVVKFYNDVENSNSIKDLQHTDTLSVIPELKKLKNHLAGMRTTLRDLLSNFDPNFKGYVSPDSFYRQLGFGNDIKKIVHKYMNESTGGVSYLLIQKDIDNIDTIFKPEKPDLKEIAANIDRARFDIAYALSQFDRSRCGRIASDQFVSLIHDFCHDISPIVSFYTDCDGYINVRDFLNDLMSVTKQIQTTQLTSNSIKTKQPVSNPEETIDYLKQQLYLRHIHPKFYFGERSNEKYLPMPLFCHIISQMKIFINQSDILPLAEHFNTPNGVDLQSFLQRFDMPQKGAPTARISDLRDYLLKTHQRFSYLAARSDRQKEGFIDGATLRTLLTRLQFYFTREDISAYIVAFPAANKNYLDWKAFSAAVDPPEIETPTPHYYDSAEPIKPRTERAKAELKDEVLPILQKINTAARRLCVSIEDEFTSNDSLKTGQVSVKSFYEIISFAELSSQELQILIRNYPEVNYVDLCKHLKSEKAQPLLSSSAIITSGNNAKIYEMLSQLKSNLQYNAINIGDIITPNMNVERATNLLMKFSKDSPAILNSFRDKRRPEIVDLFELQRALDMTKAAKAKILKCNLTTLNTELCAMRQKAQARRRKLDSIFQGCERSISVDEFIKRLNSFSISLGNRELEIIKAKYELDGGIDWMSLCKDAENSHAH
ncbi:hypothetical protein TVAG_301460 [Trichomonas vaginalis G3]|uniref:EF hand family protein n=1 Tax=Trichomonas vaginalis (strain ATCC PRA-98 / G3) TaxID=412133 RepID=A2E5G8_TRIV3|nr:EF-Hand calcium-binding domain-containing protein 6-related family [Trichomonas vaginalis G3]EAY12129.1 hypothetical protein TVAG_301460 [Trichomonas vaginalis G3]KAI5542384.1 EF-Hand calcium-binding domain-containing protein 6-related family [Trichomonas vaginalis G3]|eukprot:XP_001324352.1 hypothetical protein [Trichomonas vaginalis G3]